MGSYKIWLKQSLYYMLIVSDVLTSKYPDIKEKEMSSDLSRWFSGAKDREGGKKERIVNKSKNIVIHD